VRKESSQVGGNGNRKRAEGYTERERRERE